jgi:C1A family cysteine protease
LKYLKRYVILIILIIGVYVYWNKGEETQGEVVKSSASEVSPVEWKEQIARTMNQNQLEILLNGELLKVSREDVYLTEDLTVMGSLSAAKEFFACIGNIYDDTSLILEKNGMEIVLKVDSDKMIVDESEEAMKASITEQEGELYLPLESIGNALGYEIELRASSNEVKISSDAPELILPEFYDYREKGREPLVKDQGEFGTCWAVAASSAMESALLPQKNYEFSPDHMSLQNSFSLTQDDGGGFTMSIAYLAGWQGPVLEEEDPYGDGYSPDGLESVVHVQEVQLIKSGDIEGIKEAVYKYGAVQSAIYMALEFPESESIYYNRENQAYAYTGDEEQNHDIVIIGWDNNFPASDFSQPVEGNGAFICQNSWGERFGDQGVFYISYYDSKIAEYNAVYTSIEKNDNYDNIYQADLCGWTGQVGYSADTAYFSNAYTAETKEKVRAVGFYATDENTEYEIYIVRNFADADSFKNQEYLQSGTIEHSGYYTIDLEKDIEVEAGEKFALAVKVTTPYSQYPIAIEYPGDEAPLLEIDLTDGEGYISSDGIYYGRAEEIYECNICLKVYTDIME